MIRGRSIFWDKRGKRLAQLRIALANPGAHIDFVREMRRARSRGTASATALSGVKYLGVYMTERFAPEQRRQTIVHHHRFLDRAIKPDMWRGRAVLWSLDTDPKQQIILRRAQLAPMEGEHELIFEADGRMLCTLTFSVVTGKMLGMDLANAMFIGGVQGGLGTREAIRAAAKANGEIAPSAMLMIAAKAFAEALGIVHLIGLPAASHPARFYAADRISFDYDRLWLDSGAAQDDGWFVIGPHSCDRPLEELARSHRGRTRRKRERKAGIHATMLRTLAAHLRRADPPESRVVHLRPLPVAA